MAAERRSKRPGEYDRDGLLEALWLARKSLIEARRCMRPKSGLARSAEAVIAEIDELAFVMTGDQAYFHAAAHGSPAKGGNRPG